jgi:methylase of polypeptide subunit release factors
LKNSFAPLLIGKFDFVVGNPPWINWEHLPQKYREDTKKLWDSYGLLEKTKGMGLGKVKRDMAMLFLARCLDRYTKEGGSFAFLIPFTLYKTQAGAGFRKFLANGLSRNEKKVPCKVLKIHDLVTLYPFEGATNRTSLIVIKKSGKTGFPIPCVSWVNPRSKGIDQEAELDEVKETTKQFKLILVPIRKNKPETSWMITNKVVFKVLQKVMKPSEYRAYAGVFTGINSVYFVNVLSKTAKGIMVRNLASVGKKKVKEIEAVVEPQLVFSLLRGQDHKKWYIKHKNYILVPVDDNGKILSHSELKIKFPQTYQFFFNFFNELIRRGAEPYNSKLKPYREMSISKAERKSPPFYWLFNVLPSFATYKVMWKHIAGKISGKGEFSVAVAGPVSDEYLGKKISIPIHKLTIIPLSNKNEAHYIASVLNSSIAQLVVMGYTIETAISTHILKNIFVPKFNSKNKLHLKLSQLSQKAHELAKKYYEDNDKKAKEELKKVEDNIDKTVAKLYGISEKELEEIKNALKILKGEVYE